MLCEGETPWHSAEENGSRRPVEKTNAKPEPMEASGAARGFLLPTLFAEQHLLRNDTLTVGTATDGTPLLRLSWHAGIERLPPANGPHVTS